MLRSIYILIATLLALTASNAQSLQVKAGFNITNLTGGSPSKSRSGYYIGVAKAIPLSKRISFQPEVFYSLQGARIGPDLRPDLYRYHYVQMPLYFKFSFGDWGGMLGGPQIGLLSRAKVITGRDQTHIVTSFMNLFDIQVGGGPYMNFGRLSADLRIVAGVTPVDREDDRVRSLGFQAGLAWSLTKQSDKE